MSESQGDLELTFVMFTHIFLIAIDLVGFSHILLVVVEFSQGFDADDAEFCQGFDMDDEEFSQGLEVFDGESFFHAIMY
jgi:hypothetical protein